MSKSVNECLLIGNAGQDPKISQIGDTEVAQFTLATSQDGFTKKDGTAVAERTQWHTIVAWRGLAKLARYIHKGDKVVVRGSIVYREYDKDGTKHYVTDIVANDIVLTTKGEGGGRPAITAADIPAMPATPSYRPQPAQQYAPAPPAQPYRDNGDLPF